MIQAVCMPRDYTGPNDTDDSNDLGPDQAAALMATYKLLGEAFGDSADEDRLGHGWLIELALEMVHSYMQARQG